MLSTNELSPLELLPLELFSMLIEHAPESVCKLRLASRSLQSSVDDFVRSQMAYPLVEVLEITDRYFRRRQDYKLKVRLTISPKNTALFELRYKLWQPLVGIKTEKITHIADVFYREFEWEFRHLDDVVVKNLSDFIGRRPKIVWIDDEFDNEKRQAQISILLENKQFHRLKFAVTDLMDKSLTFLKTVINQHNVEHLYFHLDEVYTTQEPEETLLELSSLLSSLKIHQYPVQSIPKSTNYLFGMYDANWDEIIPKMFSRKLNRLDIENEDYPYYLQPTSVDILLEQLPSIEKKIWFSAVILSDFRAKQQVNGSLVQTFVAMDYPCFDNFTCINIAIFVKPRRLDMPSRIIYRLILSIEILLLISLFLVVSRIIGIVWKSILFHPNLRRMVTFLLAHSYLYITCRIPLILFQECVFRLDFTDGVSASEVVLIISSVLRLYHGLSVLFLYCATVIERVIATIYMHDYESKRRLSISITLRLSVVFISLFLALEITYDFLKTTYMTYLVLIVFCASTSALTSFYLYFYNRYRLKHVLKRTDAYSLSLRYQLIENMRAFRFLQTITACGVCGITVICLILAVPHFLLPYSSSARTLCGAAFDTVYALTFLTGILLCFLSQPVWKRELVVKLRHFRFWRKTSGPQFADLSRTTSAKSLKADAMNAHFVELAKNWDLQLKKAKK